MSGELQRCFCGPSRVLRVLGVALALASATLGCHALELPPQRPTTTLHDRTASRIDLVDFVIADRARAAKVRSLYVDIERAMLEARRIETFEQGKLEAGCLHTPEQLRESFEVARAAEVAALERYAQAQIQVRCLTTPLEYARLNAIK